MSQDIEELVGIGTISAGWLRKVGIQTRLDLETVGVIEAYRRVRESGQNTSFNLLWALQGALDDIHWSLVPPAQREQLKHKLNLADQDLS